MPDSYAEHIKKVVDQAPPLTPDAVARLRRILRAHDNVARDASHGDRHEARD